MEIRLGYARVGGDSLLERFGGLVEPTELEQTNTQLVVVAYGWSGLDCRAISRLSLVATSGIDQHIAQQMMQWHILWVSHRRPIEHHDRIVEATQAVVALSQAEGQRSDRRILLHLALECFERGLGGRLLRSGRWLLRGWLLRRLDWSRWYAGRLRRNGVDALVD